MVTGMPCVDNLNGAPAHFVINNWHVKEIPANLYMRILLLSA